MTETWKHFENGYYFSNLGNVRGPRGHLLRPQLVGNKYPYLAVSIKRRSVKIHQVVCILFNNSKPSEGYEVAHNNGDKFDNRADNLRWATKQENSDDRTKHGNVPQGETHGRAKLTQDQVLDIRKRLQNKYYGLQKELCAQYGVDRKTIQQIEKRTIWGWLE